MRGGEAEECGGVEGGVSGVGGVWDSGLDGVEGEESGVGVCGFLLWSLDFVSDRILILLLRIDISLP